MKRTSFSSPTKNIPENDSEAPQRAVTARVVILSLLLAVLFGYIIPYIDVYFSNTFLGAAHLPPGAVGALLILLLVVNPFLKILSRRWTFTRNELLTIYVTCLFSCLVPGHGGENFFVSVIIGPFYFASPENKWMSFLQPHLSHWFTPALLPNGQVNTELVEGWYLGSGAIPWAAWIIPLLAWSSMILASYIMLGCLSVMLRAQWSEREALAYPLLKVPQEMTEGKNGDLPKLFSNKGMWIGFGIAVSIELINGLNKYFPDVPRVPLNLPSSQFFTEVPWNQLNISDMQIWLMVVGITYLLTSEVSFSLWFFYWFIKLQFLFAYSIGMPPAMLPKMAESSVPLFAGFQQIGAYFGMAAIVVWAARKHLWHIVNRAFGRVRAKPDEKREALSYPAAFWGFVFSFVFLICWSVTAGIAPHIALLLWTIYLVLAITLTRIVVECGLLFVQQG